MPSPAMSAMRDVSDCRGGVFIDPFSMFAVLLIEGAGTQRARYPVRKNKLGRRCGLIWEWRVTVPHGTCRAMRFWNGSTLPTSPEGDTQGCKLKRIPKNGQHFAPWSNDPPDHNTIYRSKGWQARNQ